MLKYLKRYKTPDADWEEISKEDALRTLLGSYLDNDITRELLESENAIPCMFSDILVITAE